MKRYYTRACNFYYGENSIKLVNKNKSIPLNGNKKISFDQIEVISRNSKKIIPLSKINSLSKLLILLNGIISIEFLDINSIWSKDIFLLPLSGIDFFLFTNFIEFSP